MEDDEPKAPSSSQSLEQQRERVQRLQRAGQTQKALQAQQEFINSASPRDLKAGDYHRLGVLHFAVKNFSKAAQCFEKTVNLDPDFSHASLNWGLSLIRGGDLKKSRALLEQNEKRYPKDSNLLAGLADVCGKLGDLEEARQYGERVLTLTDQQAQKPPRDFSLPQQPPPAFCPDRPKENVISFSLFGSAAQYCEGAIRNAVVAPYLYPGWRCRFYCDDSVPERARSMLQGLGAEIAMMPRPARPTDALFWRFLVIDDASVSRFLIRDCDSVLNIRERLAVSEWLNSDKYFHVMRDHSSHTSLIQAGMWGGVAAALPPLQAMINGFAYEATTQARTADQTFLSSVIWPYIKPSCMIHDRVYRVFEAKDFPGTDEWPLDRHVGENDAALKNQT